MPRPIVPTVATSRTGVRLAANRLAELGIPFVEDRKARLLCYGLVRVVVKYSKVKWDRDYPRFEFHTTPIEKRERRLDADLVLLICDREDSVGFYVFEAKDKVFYKANGALKTFWGYVVDAKPYDGTNSLTRWKMAENANRFDRIEATLQRMLAEQKAAQQSPAVTVRFAPPILP